jgi:hypothetical protein
MTHDGKSIKITGGTFNSSAIGIGRIEQRVVTVGSDSGLAELRAMVAAHAAEIVALGRDEDRRDEIRHELRKIEQELGGEAPDGSAVKTRWKAVLAVLDGALDATRKVADITDLVQRVFGV